MTASPLSTIAGLGSVANGFFGKQITGYDANKNPIYGPSYFDQYFPSKQAPAPVVDATSVPVNRNTLPITTPETPIDNNYFNVPSDQYYNSEPG